MTEAEARSEIETFTQASAYPALTSGDVDQLVAWAKRKDSAGRVPSDADWEETWDLNGAIARGWRLKAAKVANAYDQNASGQNLSRSQMLRHCQAMAREWSRGAGYSLVLSGRSGERGLCDPCC